MSSNMYPRWRILWGALILLGAAACLQARPVELTPEDRAWLKTHHRILFSYDPDFVPFSYRDEEGRFVGLDADVLKVLAERLGVEFVPVYYRNWTEAYQAAKEREVLMLTSTASLPERTEFFDFTRPYVSFPVAILTRESGKNFDNIEQLAGRRVAAVKDYAPTLRLMREHPEVEVVECASVAEALRAVASGRADATLTNLVNASYEIRRSGLTGLKVAGVAPFTFELRYAVHRGEPALVRVLDAAVASLDEPERQALMAPWVKLESGAIVSWRSAVHWGILACVTVALIAGLAGWHNQTLRKELEKRQRLQEELEASHQRLENLNEENAGLMRMAAHDLRNPLAGLLLSIDLLKVGPVAKREETMDRMVVLINQLLAMVRNLLDVQALESGTRKMLVEPITIRTALEESLATYQAAATRKGIKLEIGEISPLLAVMADRSAFRQVCDNLVSNAVKYSPTGSPVRVAANRAESGRVCIAVIDRGPGVLREEMDRLFQKYTCLSARPTGGEASTGLGLSIVKELVQRMGGSVWCESDPGHGATFWVELPEAGAGGG
jgi:two-component system, NarL family, sensor histidine kinase EvgS